MKIMAKEGGSDKNIILFWLIICTGYLAFYLLFYFAGR
jgi:hypothetical protein